MSNRKALRSKGSAKRPMKTTDIAAGTTMYYAALRFSQHSSPMDALLSIGMSAEFANIAIANAGVNHIVQNVAYHYGVGRHHRILSNGHTWHDRDGCTEPGTSLDDDGRAPGRATLGGIEWVIDGHQVYFGGPINTSSPMVIPPRSMNSQA